MAKIFFAGFQAGNRRYEHAIDQETEDTYVCEVDKEEPIYRTNPGGWVHNRHGVIVGRFMKLENGNWFYVAKDESMRVNTKFSNRHTAEVDVFAVLLAFGYKE